MCLTAALGGCPCRLSLTTQHDSFSVGSSLAAFLDDSPSMGNSAINRHLIYCSCGKQAHEVVLSILLLFAVSSLANDGWLPVDLISLAL